MMTFCTRVVGKPSKIMNGAFRNNEMHEKVVMKDIFLYFNAITRAQYSFLYIQFSLLTNIFNA
jgi:hypothetical protein